MRSAGALALAATVLAGCGGSGSDRPEVLVSAASSLKAAFTSYGRSFSSARVRFSFAASDELAGQVRRGARPHVFAAANRELPTALWREGLVERPVVFAANRLVLAVPAGSERVRSLRDLERPGVRLAVGSPSVPVGAYTDRVLAGLGPARRRRVLAAVRSREPDVAGVVGKVSAGAVDAGFVYATDVRAAGGRLRAIALPARLRPTVAYAAAVVRGAAERAAARAFVAGLRSGAGAAALRRAGFVEAPR